MTLQDAIKKLREELERLSANRIEFNLGYGAAIRDLEHIAKEMEENKYK